MFLLGKYKKASLNLRKLNPRIKRTFVYYYIISGILTYSHKISPIIFFSINVSPNWSLTLKALNKNMKFKTKF